MKNVFYKSKSFFQVEICQKFASSKQSEPNWPITLRWLIPNHGYRCLKLTFNNQICKECSLIYILECQKNSGLLAITYLLIFWLYFTMVYLECYYKFGKLTFSNSNNKRCFWVNHCELTWVQYCTYDSYLAFL
jgi:hypothetical protein